MICFNAAILRFDQQGEKTGWFYIDIPADTAQDLLPGNKKSFRVKGKLDDHTVRQVALMPMGNGNFIMALNATMRKAIHKSQGAMVKVQLELDTSTYEINSELLDCLEDEPDAKEYFDGLPRSHRAYYSKWIESAKTIPTRTKRIAMAVSAMARGMDFGQMLREQKKLNEL